MAVRFLSFLNSGIGRIARGVKGPTANLTYIQNGVELQFEVTPDVLQQYRNLRPRQWAGPEAVYKKVGLPLGTPWINVVRSQGGSPDDPMPVNVLTDPALIAYYDAPGPNMTPYLGNRTSWVHVIQNFTGWVEGTSIANGRTERLCEVAAWYSIVSTFNENWDDPQGAPRWQRTPYNKTDTGWTNIDTTPPL